MEGCGPTTPPPSGAPPSAAVEAHRAACRRDEAITKLCGLLGEMVPPAAQLLAAHATRPPDLSSETDWTRQVARAARQAARDEIQVMLDGEIRSLASSLDEASAHLESEGVRLDPLVDQYRTQIDALQTLRYRLYGHPLDLRVT